METSIIKWRQNIYEPFEYFTIIPKDFIKKFIGPITPLHGHEITFNIVDNVPILSDLKALLHPVSRKLTMQVNDHFYLIEGDTLFVCKPELPVQLLSSFNIISYTTDEKVWHPIKEAVFHNQFCVVCHDPKAFCVIGGPNNAVRFVTKTEAIQTELKEKSFEDFLAMISIENYIIH